MSRYAFMELEVLEVREQRQQLSRGSKESKQVCHRLFACSVKVALDDDKEAIWVVEN